MRECVVHPAALIACVLFALGASSSATTAGYWSVVNQPARLVNGSPVLFRVTTPKPVRTLSGSWLGHEIAFSFDASRKSWFALAGVSLETKPGAYPLQLHGETLAGQSAGQAISFEKRFRVQRRSEERRVGKECRSRWS